MLQCSKKGQSMTPLDWMKQERERLLAQIERLQSGAFRIGHDNGSGWVDATADHIATSLASLAEYDLGSWTSPDLVKADDISVRWPLSRPRFLVKASVLRAHFPHRSGVRVGQ